MSKLAILLRALLQSALFLALAGVIAVHGAAPSPPPPRTPEIAAASLAAGKAAILGSSSKSVQPAAARAARPLPVDRLGAGSSWRLEAPASERGSTFASARPAFPVVLRVRRRIPRLNDEEPPWRRFDLRTLPQPQFWLS